MSEQLGETSWFYTGYTVASGLQWEAAPTLRVPIVTVPSALQDSLDARAEHVSVLDAFGNLLWVNKAWREFGRRAGMVDPAFGVGMNYLDVCGRSQRQGAPEAAIIAGGIREVIAGVYNSVYFRYGFDSPERRNLFAVRVTRLVHHGALRLIVAHERIF